MKFSITSYNAVATWKWATSTEPHKLYHYAKTGGDGPEDDDEDDEDEDDVCGICRLAFEACCPDCKVPGDDCPLIWGECSHIFHMHCLLKWIGTESSKQQCPMDRRPWATQDRSPDKLPTTVDRAPVAALPPGPLPVAASAAGDEGREEEQVAEPGEVTGTGDAESELDESGRENSMEVDEER